MKNMNRRKFMKMLAGTIAGCVVAPSMLVATPEPLPEMPLRGSYIYSKERAKSLGYKINYIKPRRTDEEYRGQIAAHIVGLDICGNFQAKPIYDKDFYKKENERISKEEGSQRECNCPALYKAAVSNKPTPHFDYCDKKSKIFNGQERNE